MVDSLMTWVEDEEADNEDPECFDSDEGQEVDAELERGECDLLGIIGSGPPAALEVKVNRGCS